MTAAAEFKSLEDHTWWLLRTLQVGALVFALTPVAGALWVLLALQRDRATAVPEIIAVVRSEVSSSAYVMPVVALAFVVWLWRAYGNLPGGAGSAALMLVVRGVAEREAARALRLGLTPDAGGAGPDVVARARSRSAP